MAKKKAHKNKLTNLSHQPHANALSSETNGSSRGAAGGVSDQENQSIKSNQSPQSMPLSNGGCSGGKNMTAPSSSCQQETDSAQCQSQQVSNFGQVAQADQVIPGKMGLNSIQKQHHQRPGIVNKDQIMAQEYYLEDSGEDADYQHLEYGEEQEDDDAAKNTTAADEYYDEIQPRANQSVQQDEQVLSDLKYCLYCVYNNLELSQYFKQLLRLSKRLKDCYFGQLNANVLFSIFDLCIKEFLHGIRDKLVEDARGLISHKRLPQQRHYSHDDYCLIDRMVTQHGKVAYGGAQSVEMFAHCSRYLADGRYEQVRAQVRRQVFAEWRGSTEGVVPFAQKPEHYRRLFDLIIKYYTRVREAVVGVEEIWVFLIESVFQRQLSGNLLFEQHHKQLFRSEILQSHRYLQLFLKEIKDSFRQLELRRQKRQKTQYDAILDNLYDVLLQLEDDINYQPQLNQQSPTDEEEEEIVTYQQLGDRIREKYGGQTLAQQVQQYSQTYATSQTILKQIQQDKRCQELLKSLPNLDTETLCYIIQNNLPPEDYEKLLVGGQGGQQTADQDSSLVISPSKNLQFLRQPDYLGSNQIYSNTYDENGELFYDEEEDLRQQMEKKKRKNQKKKQKRKQKKATTNDQPFAQQQSQITQFLLDNMADQHPAMSLRGYINEGGAANLFNSQEDEEELIEDDPEFDLELELFKRKLVQAQAVQKRRPNVSPSWVDSLRVKLSEPKVFNSPRMNAACKMGEPIPSSGGQQLRVRYNQRSA